MTRRHVIGICTAANQTLVCCLALSRRRRAASSREQLAAMLMLSLKVQIFTALVDNFFITQPSSHKMRCLIHRELEFPTFLLPTSQVVVPQNNC